MADAEVVRPPPPPHRVLDARRGVPGRRRRRGRGRRRAAGRRHHRPRQHVRGARDVPRRARRGHHAGARHGGLLHRRVALRPPQALRARDLPPHAARAVECRLPQPHPGEQRRVHRRLLLQAPHRLGAVRAPSRRFDRDHRLSRWARLPAHPRRQAEGSARRGGPVPGHLRARQLLHRGCRTTASTTTSA